MESLSNPNVSGNTAPMNSNVELTLLGIDKKWVRFKGKWVDKSKIPVETSSEQSPIISSIEEVEKSSRHWWQFWKA